MRYRIVDTPYFNRVAIGFLELRDKKNRLLLKVIGKGMICERDFLRSEAVKDI